MRNYLALWLTHVRVTASPVPVGSVYYFWGRDEQEMNSVTQPNIDNFISNGVTYEVVTSGKAFVMMDKAQLYGLVKAAGLLGVPPFLFQVGDSPRDTWKPSRDDPTVNPGTGAAKTHDESIPKPKLGDFSGASGLFAAFQGLAIYAAQLRAAGRLRDAGIVQFAYDQVAKQIWSVTEAFAYLAENGLV